MRDGDHRIDTRSERRGRGERRKGVGLHDGDRDRHLCAWRGPRGNGRRRSCVLWDHREVQFRSAASVIAGETAALGAAPGAAGGLCTKMVFPETGEETPRGCPNWLVALSATVRHGTFCENGVRI